jgi:hypothetical protein
MYVYHFMSVSVTPTSLQVCHVVINDCRKLKSTQLGRENSHLIQKLKLRGHILHGNLIHFTFL